MNDLIQYVQREWSTLSQAPFTFITVALLTSAIAYAIARSRFTSIIEVLRERLAASDQQLGDYRERLHYVPAHGSEYAKLTHGELQGEALKFVASLRDWLAKRSAESSARSHQFYLNSKNAMDDEQRKRIMDTFHSKMVQESDSDVSTYDSRFKGKAIVLRDELRSRVKDRAPTPLIETRYDFPCNPIEMRMVAEDLEGLARLLK